MKPINVKLYCPACRNSTWLEIETGYFECLACGEICTIEDMEVDDDNDD